MAAVSINLQMRQHADGQTEDSLMCLRIAEFRRQAQRQNRLKAQQQLLEGGVILPGGRLCGEAVRDRLVGHEGLIGLLRSEADQGNAQIVRQKADRIEDDSPLSKVAGEKGMYLVDCWPLARKHPP
jgi:hypothetical protein